MRVTADDRFYSKKKSDGDESLSLRSRQCKRPRDEEDTVRCVRCETGRYGGRRRRGDEEQWEGRRPTRQEICGGRRPTRQEVCGRLRTPTETSGSGVWIVDPCTDRGGISISETSVPADNVEGTRGSCHRRVSGLE